jgi:hypothetical protein
MRTPTSALLQPQAPNSIPKRQLLKELNTETRDVRTAINQAQSAITYALRLVGDGLPTKTHVHHQHP